MSYIVHHNASSPDKFAGGFLTDYEIVSSKTDFDSGTISVLIPKGTSPGQGLALGKTMPAAPGGTGFASMICVSLGWRAAEGGSRLFTAQYKGFASDSTSKAGGAAARTSIRVYVREESFPAGSNVIIDGGGFPNNPTENAKAVRFNNTIYAQRAVWMTNEPMTFAKAATLEPPVQAPITGTPWAGYAVNTRVFPHGWVLRNLSAERIADGVELYACDAEWLFEWKYQPGG